MLLTHCVIIVSFLNFSEIMTEDSSVDELVSMYLRSISDTKEDTLPTEEISTTLFAKVSNEKLRELAIHSNDNLSIRSRWEQVLRGRFSRRNNSEAVGKAAASWFIGVMEGRLSINVPERWSKTLAHCKISQYDRSPDAVVSLIPSSKFSGYLENEYGIFTPKSIKMELKDTAKKLYRIYVNESTFTFSSENLKLPGCCLNATSNKNTIIVTTHHKSDGSFPVIALNHDNEELWNSKVHTYSGIGSGLPGEHWTELLIVGNRVFVFGASLNDLYVQGFNLSDGSTAFKFNVSE